MGTMPPNPPSILAFLRQCRQLLSKPLSPGKQPVLVIGNPSADLDSFASAILYAYFHSLPPNTRPHIPVLNVPFPSHDIARQRPEFAAALAVRKKDYYNRGWEERRNQLEEQEFKPDDDGGILAEVVTRHDLQESAAFSSKQSEKSGPLDAILVDWNSLDGDSSSSKLTSSQVRAVGCVDHHIDEHFLPSQIRHSDSDPPAPRTIQTAGSCTSLVIKHLLDSSLWPSSPASSSAETTHCDEEAQTIQLGLSAILIDTTNLTSKNEDVDDQIVELLTRTMGPDWDRDKFHDELKTAKRRGLELLSLEEVLGKDYKEWEISPPSSTPEGGKGEKLGIASVVLSLRKLISRLSTEEDDGVKPFISTLASFTESHNLSVLAIMTNSTSPHKGFQRELLLYAFKTSAATKLSSFVESEKSSELGLEPWDGFEELKVDGRAHHGEEVGAGWRSVFWQREVSKSRKQVAPLLREALGENMK
jgi:exopolyphosphatase